MKENVKITNNLRHT